jgi:hypothetical protein
MNYTNRFLFFVAYVLIGCIVTGWLLSMATDPEMISKVRAQSTQFVMLWPVVLLICLIEKIMNVSSKLCNIVIDYVILFIRENTTQLKAEQDENQNNAGRLH